MSETRKRLCAYYDSVLSNEDEKIIYEDKNKLTQKYQTCQSLLIIGLMPVMLGLKKYAVMEQEISLRFQHHRCRLI